MICLGAMMCYKSDIFKSNDQDVVDSKTFSESRWLV